MKQSLGIIEVVGLALAISVSDQMAKAAHIQLLEIVKTKGSGWMVIKVSGDVAAVQAAIVTGKNYAKEHKGFVSCQVIARPATHLGDVFLKDGKAKAATPPVMADAISNEQPVLNDATRPLLLTTSDEVQPLTKPNSPPNVKTKKSLSKESGKKHKEKKNKA